MLFRLLKENLIIIVIVLLGAALRFLFLDYVPASLNWDEVSHGYNAYSILVSGKDEWGNKFPTIFRAYGDYKLPVYIYLTAISEFVFGLTPFAVRFTSALAGTITVIFTYLLVIEMGRGISISKLKSREKFTSLFAALFVAISPWTLHLSRGAFEANLALTFIVIGTYFFYRSFHSIKYFVISTIFFGLSVWTYNSARIFTPIFFVLLITVNFSRLKNELITRKNVCFISVSIIALFFVPMFYQLLSPVGSARYDKVSILNEGGINKIVDLRVNSELPPIIARVLYNKVTYFASEFVRNYSSHVSPEYLYFKGGSQYQFSVPNFGLLYLVNAIFLLIGIIILGKDIYNNRNKISTILIVWFLIGPIASSITRESPHVLRSITMLVSPMIITAVGFSFVYYSIDKYRKLILLTYLIVLSLFLGKYLEKYTTVYRNNYSWSFQYGYKEVSEYVGKNYNLYDKFIITKKYGEPHEFILFYNMIDPETYRGDPNLNRFEQSNWFWVDSFAKYNFVNDWDVTSGPSKYEFILESKKTVDCSNDIKCLLVTSPGNVPEGWTMINEIYFLDGEKAFEFYAN